MTKQGWKLFSDVDKDDEYLTLDTNNNTLYIKASKIVKKQFTGNLHHWRSSQIDLMVTPNHNMWLGNADNKKYDFIKSENANNKRYRFMKSANPNNKIGFKSIILPPCEYNNNFHVKFNKEIELDADPFFELLGIWITDGHIQLTNNKSGQKLIITQIKENGRKRIEELLNILGLKYRKDKIQFFINCPQLHKWITKHFIKNGQTAKTNYISIPRWIFEECSISNLESLLKGIILGNGTPHTKGNGYQIYTGSEQLAEDLVELALHIGMCANKYNLKPRNRKIGKNDKISICRETYMTSIINTNEHFFQINNNTVKNEVFYNGFVYCVELPKFHRLYVMRNGKGVWCGNTHEIIRHRIASYSQESTRYCNYCNDKFGNELTFIEPCFFNSESEEDKKNKEIWLKSMQFIEEQYNMLIENGAKPEEARAILPNSLKTEIVITMNLRSWRHFLKLRTDKSAHPQIREIANMILNEFNIKLPIIFGNL